MSDKLILDPACGGRMWWFDRSHPNVVYGDKKPSIQPKENLTNY